MGSVRSPQPAKLLVGALSADESRLEEARALCAALYGPCDYVSPLLPFEHTRYYETEFGPGLRRCFWAHQRLIDPSRLAEIKRTCNAIEAHLQRDGRRTVNLDPGYLTPAKLVLASTKDHAHRVYLGRGIYAEVTLAYREGGFRVLPWTYPDYRSADYARILAAIRALYMRQLQALTRRSG